MGWSYEIFLPERRVDSAIVGTFSDDDMIDHMRALGQDPDFREDFEQLMDLSGMTKLELTPAGIRANFERSPFGHGSRRAIVVASDAMFGMARMFQILRDENKDEIRIFRSRTEAEHWLEHGDEDPDPENDDASNE